MTNRLITLHFHPVVFQNSPVEDIRTQRNNNGYGYLRRQKDPGRGFGSRLAVLLNYAVNEGEKIDLTNNNRYDPYLVTNLPFASRLRYLFMEDVEPLIWWAKNSRD